MAKQSNVLSCRHETLWYPYLFSWASFFSWIVGSMFFIHVQVHIHIFIFTLYLSFFIYAPSICPQGMYLLFQWTNEHLGIFYFINNTIQHGTYIGNKKGQLASWMSIVFIKPFFSVEFIIDSLKQVNAIWSDFCFWSNSNS